MNRFMVQIVLTLFIMACLLGNGLAAEGTDLKLLLPRPLPEGWIQTEGPRVFNPKTLFERINGQAELYLKYGFRKSVFAGYQNQKKPDLQVELDLYDMGKVLQAFGIFSRFRTEDRPVGIGLGSDLGENTLLFYKGNYFAMIYCTESNPPIMKAFGEAVSTRITGPSEAPKETRYFPATGLKPGSVQYLPESLLGLRFLKRGFQGIYEGYGKPEKEASLFVTVFESAKESQNALKSYRDYLRDRGTLSKTPEGVGSQSLGGEDPYKGRVLAVQKERYLVGAIGFEKEEDAERLVTEMMKNMK